MIELARRKKTQGPPPRVVFEALTQPHREPTREWLLLAPDEVEPRVIDAHEPDRVVWSTLWPAYPAAEVEFEIAPEERGSGTVLTWILSSELPAPDDETVTRLRHRLNEIINRDLRLILFDY
jgi:hypothetical protein